MTIGYPVHAVAQYAEKITNHGVHLTRWVATCGATGEVVGSNPFGVSGSARWRELCVDCWPARHATSHPTPALVDW